MLINSAWIDKTAVHTINPKALQGYDFNTAANEIRFSLKCSNSCDMFLVNQQQFDNLRQGRSFTYFWHATSTRDSGPQIYSQITNIRNKLIIVVKNPSSVSSLTADFFYGWYISAPSSPWVKTEYNNMGIPVKGFHGYDFPLNAAIIRFTIKKAIIIVIYF